MIRMRTQNLIDRKHQMLREQHRQCEEALASVQTRVKDAFKGYGDAYEEALGQHLKIVTESTITEDTLKQELLLAANAHTESVKNMRAHPPLLVFMDDTRINLQIRVAAAEEKDEDLQRELRVIAGKDSKAEIASLQEELGELRKANQKLDEKLRKVNSDHDRMKSTAQMDESLRAPRFAVWSPPLDPIKM